MFIAVVASLGASLLYAAASALQQRAAAQAPIESSMRLGLLARLAVNPVWLAGIAADAAAFGLQFFALGKGALVVVQPVLVAGLLFALPFGASLAGRPITFREMWAAAAVAAGLAAVLVASNPSSGRTQLSDSTWAIVGVATLIPVALVVIAAGRVAAARPPLLALAAGTIYAVTAALAKSTAHALNFGVVHTLQTWQLWALIPGGVLGMIVCQSAFQAGPLPRSLPALTVIDPIVSTAIGVLAFHEKVNDSASHLAVELAGAAAMVAGVWVLARSPLVALEDEKEESVGNHR